MKKIALLSLLIVSIAYAGELEKEIKYIGNDGTVETHEIICINGKSGMITIHNSTKEMTIESSNTNLGKVTFFEAVEMICK